MTGLSRMEPDIADAGDDIRPGRASGTAIYHDIARIVERMHRRFLDVVRVELGRVGIDDICEPLEGCVCPEETHVGELIEFLRGWEPRAPLVIHCYAGISRSTAAAFIVACALHPERDEAEIAAGLRRASRSATPNRRLVAVADGILGRNGRMVDAIERIGRGAEAFEGEPFTLTFE